MSNFEWQQEDGDWDDSPAVPSSEPSKLKRRLAIVIVVILALLGAGFVLYQQVIAQLQQTETAVQSDILVSHNLVQNAASSQDRELLFTVLSGRLPSWSDAQQAALSAGVLYDRTPWGLSAVTDSSVPLTVADLDGAVRLRMSPDLREAELYFPLSYQFTTVSGISETVILSQTAVYRQGTRSWLLSPPDTDFWGEWQTWEGKQLTLIYPERDSSLVEKLADDLEQLLKQLCTDSELPACAEDSAYTIRFDPHPESLVDAADFQNLFGVEPYINLPAPTLFGLPGDEVAYEALLQAYGVPLATAVFAELFEWKCCRHQSIFQLLTTYQLSEMGITNWPVTHIDHINALHEGRDFSELEGYWQSTQTHISDESEAFLYMTFDFIFNQYPDLSPVSLLNSFQDGRAMAYWLSDSLSQTGYQLGSVNGLWPMFQNEWWHYAYTQNLLSQQQEPPPIPLPAQDIALSCLSDARFDLDTTMSLYRFTREDDSWQELLAYNSFILFHPFLNDDGLIVQSMNLDSTNSWKTEIWSFYGVKTTLDDNESMFFSLGQFEPNGRYIVTFAGEDEIASPQPMLMDLDSCVETSCDMQPLPGLPKWSPDGNHTLITGKDIFASSGTPIWQNGRIVLFDATQAPQSTDFWLGDGLGQLPVDKTEAEVVGVGYSPFWIDNDTFGFVRDNPETEMSEIFIRSIDESETEIILELADIEAVAPNDTLTFANIRYVMTHPAQPNHLFVVVLDALGHEAYVFMFDRTSGELDLRVQSPIQPYHSLGFSPNGRWLVLTGSEFTGASESNVFVVHDIETNETQTYTSNLSAFMLSSLYDWSADGNWLLFLVNEQVFSMVAPEYNYQAVQVHEQGTCTAMAWINQ